MSGSTAETRIGVALVDDQRLMREGLRTLLELHADLQVVGEAGDGVEAESVIERCQPQVVLMDLRMPRRDGVAATRRITSRWPRVQVLVLTTFDDDDLVFESIAAGAVGYLLKDVGSEALAEAVRVAARGGSPLQPSVARKVLRRLRAASPTAGIPTLGQTGPEATPATPIGALGPALEPLTERELSVLRWLGAGATNRQIAEQLGLTEGTVKNYISAILAKTGCHDRTQAALLAVRRGLA